MNDLRVFRGCRQGTSLELRVEGMREIYDEPILRTITVSLIRGTAAFISLVRRREELLQSNIRLEEQNQQLSKRLAPLLPQAWHFREPEERCIISKAPLSISSVSDLSKHNRVEWNLEYLHKYVENCDPLAWTDDSKSQLTLKDSNAEFFFGMDNNDHWYGDPRVVKLIMDLLLRFPGQVNLVRAIPYKIPKPDDKIHAIDGSNPDRFQYDNNDAKNDNREVDDGGAGQGREEADNAPPSSRPAIPPPARTVAAPLPQSAVPRPGDGTLEVSGTHI